MVPRCATGCKRAALQKRKRPVARLRATGPLHGSHAPSDQSRSGIGEFSLNGPVATVGGATPEQTGLP